MRQIVRKVAILATVVLAFTFPTAAFAASDDASACGQYHGVFGAADGTVVGDHASAGYYKFGVVGDLNSDPACHL